MKDHPRIFSILNSNQLDTEVTGYSAFNLAQLELSNESEFELPTNLRLGHLTEKIVAELIKTSSNFKLLHENVQIIEGKQTVGELDFIVVDKKKDRIIHLELAYKFYLFDPNISNDPIYNWIGPNRSDSLVEKLVKLKEKQFPLLYHTGTKDKLHPLNVDEIEQEICFLISLYVPLKERYNFSSAFRNAIKGFYLNLEDFEKSNHTKKHYYLPRKTEWGIDPSTNQIWQNFDEVYVKIKSSLVMKKAPLCWQKTGDTYQQFFIIWW